MHFIIGSARKWAKVGPFTWAQQLGWASSQPFEVKKRWIGRPTYRLNGPGKGSTVGLGFLPAFWVKKKNRFRLRLTVAMVNGLTDLTGRSHSIFKTLLGTKEKEFISLPIYNHRRWVWYMIKATLIPPLWFRITIFSLEWYKIHYFSVKEYKESIWQPNIRNIF